MEKYANQSLLLVNNSSTLSPKNPENFFMIRYKMRRSFQVCFFKFHLPFDTFLITARFPRGPLGTHFPGVNHSSAVTEQVCTIVYMSMQVCVFIRMCVWRQFCCRESDRRIKFQVLKQTFDPFDWCLLSRRPFFGLWDNDGVRGKIRTTDDQQLKLVFVSFGYLRQRVF